MKTLFFSLAVAVAFSVACDKAPTSPSPLTKTDTLTVVQKDTVKIYITVRDTVTISIHDTVWVRVQVPVTLASADTLYATRMGLSTIRESLPGGWLSQRWEDEWTVSISWWYNPAWINRRLIVHQQDGGTTTIGAGRDLHVFAGSRSRIDGWWDSGFTVRSDK